MLTINNTNKEERNEEEEKGSKKITIEVNSKIKEEKIGIKDF